MGEGPDRLADGGEAVAAGRGEISGEAEGLERIDGRVGEGGGRETAEEFAGEHDEAADERRFGVAAEVTHALALLRDEPDDRDAAVHAVGVDALRGRERWHAPGAVDDEGEALLQIIEEGEVGDELVEFPGERHGGKRGRRAERGKGEVRANEAACRLGSFAAGLRCVESGEPTLDGGDGWSDGADYPELLGP